MEHVGKGVIMSVLWPNGSFWVGSRKSAFLCPIMIARHLRWIVAPHVINQSDERLPKSNLSVWKSSEVQALLWSVFRSHAETD